MKITNIIISAVIVIASLIFFYIYSDVVTYSIETTDIDFYTANVMTISEIEHQEMEGVGVDGMSTTIVSFVAQITGGDLKGQTVAVTQYHDEYLFGGIRTVEVGDKIVINKTAPSDVLSGEWIMANYDRTQLIVILVIIFFVIVILIGRFKGIAAILSLLLTLGAVFIVYIPSILAGLNVYLVTGRGAFYIIVMSLVLLNGLNAKTLCAVAGNIVGVLLAGLLSYIAHQLFMISGIVTQEHIYLATLGKDMGFDIADIVWSGVVIGALGAIMDVSMSLSSAMYELRHNMENPTPLKLIKSGLNIGHDIIGTMMNTLVLAYIGSSLVSVLLIMVYNKTYLSILNSELVLVEILQAVVGSTGILLTVPFTVLICSFVYNFNNNKKNMGTNTSP